jgi:O-antigen ligase
LGDVGVAIGFFGLFFTKNKIRLPFPVWIFTAFLLWAFLGSFASSYPEIAHNKLVDGLKLLVIIVVTINALRTAGQLRFYLIFLLGCFILFPVRGALVNFFIGGYNVFGRALWNYIYANPNDLAALCLLALGVAIAIIMSTSSRNLVRFGSGIAAFLLLLVILMTQSRGAFLGLVVFLFTLFICAMKRSVRIAIGMVVVMLVLAVSVQDSIWDRLSAIKMLTSSSTLHEADDEGSAAQRFEILKVGWIIFSDHKVFGVGLGAYPLSNASYAPHLGAKDTHNTYLNIAAEVGLPGLIIWLALVGSILLYAHRRQRQAYFKEMADQQRWIWWGFVAYLVAGIFGSFAALTFPYLVLAMLWCSGNILESSESPNVEKTKRSIICAE